MNRRLTVALVATATLGVLAPTASAAAKKNEIRISGGTVFKAGKYMKDEVHFNANTTVASGGTVKVVNKGSAAAGPHTVSLLKPSAMPKTLKQAEPCFQFAGVCGPLAEAHQLDPESGEPKVALYNAGAEGFDSLGDAKTAGDSVFFAPGKGTSFKVTAKAGSVLPFFCAVHPWMQGKITVK
jgi:plastocyanin